MKKSSVETSNAALPQQDCRLSELHLSMTKEDYGSVQALTFAIKTLCGELREFGISGGSATALGAMIMAGKAILPRGVFGLWVEKELGLRRRGRSWVDGTVGSMWIGGGDWCFTNLKSQPNINI